MDKKNLKELGQRVLQIVQTIGAIISTARTISTIISMVRALLM